MALDIYRIEPFPHVIGDCLVEFQQSAGAQLARAQGLRLPLALGKVIADRVLVVARP